MDELIHEIKKVVDSVRLYSHSLNLEQIADFETRYARIIALGIQENPVLEYLRPVGKRGRKKQSKAKNLLDRFESYPTEILAFMYNFSIPFDNNQAERDNRMMKVQQKISGTFRSEEGADWFCRIRGYISTVRKNDRPVFASIIDACKGKPFIPAVALESS
jgi:transposase